MKQIGCSKVLIYIAITTKNILELGHTVQMENMKGFNALLC